ELRIGLRAGALDAQDGAVVAEMERGEVAGAERDARGGALVEIEVADDVAEAEAEERRPGERGEARTAEHAEGDGLAVLPQRPGHHLAAREREITRRTEEQADVVEGRLVDPVHDDQLGAEV